MIKKGLGRGLDSLIPKKVSITDYADFKLESDNSLPVLQKENSIIMLDPKKSSPIHISQEKILIRSL